jgi:hypothetical protein
VPAGNFSRRSGNRVPTAIHIVLDAEKRQLGATHKGDTGTSNRKLDKQRSGVMNDDGTQA